MSVSIFIAGDVVPRNRTVPLFEEKKTSFLFNDIIPIIKNCDVKIVNFESPIIDDEPTPIKKSGPCLYTRKETAEVLKEAGFNVFTLANNHFRDQGDKGVFATLNACISLDIKYVGGGRNINEARKTLFLDVKDKKIAIINACEHEFSIASETNGGSNPIDLISIYESIKQAKKVADYTIVILHGGIEHYRYPTPRMKNYYRHLVTIGADAVVNHHQHCYSGYEIFKGKPIFYGLGNFCFDWEGKTNSIWNKGYSVIFDFDENNIKYKIIPYIQCDKEPILTICPESKFAEDIEKINIAIQDDYLLKQKINEYAISKEKELLSTMQSIDNRYLTALYRRGYMGRLYSDKKLLRIKNMLSCESHYEILQQILILLTNEKK